MKTTFTAPWSKGLKISTIFVVILLAGIAGTAPLWTEAPWVGVILATCLGAPVITAFWWIKGYRLNANDLVVVHPGWEKRFPLNGLKSARHEPDAMRMSLRTCGVGGLFSFSGWFWNRRLGHYRLYATDSANTVVIETQGHPVVITPDDPGGFVEAFSAATAAAAISDKPDA